MKFYQIKDSLIETEKDVNKTPYVAVVSKKEWESLRDEFQLEIDIEPIEENMTSAIVGYDVLVGSFSIPNRKDLDAEDDQFAFCVNENGVIFIDESGYVEGKIEHIRKTKKWAMPSLERFLYDFLDSITWRDLRLMEQFEDELDNMEKELLKGEASADLAKLNKIRSELRYLLIHYDQLLDLAQELEENENEFFQEENLRYFHLFLSRVERLRSTASYLRDYSVQIRDLNQQNNETRQNNIMTILTIVTSIFMPLTLIAGWYGMNFKYMPELSSVYAYPLVILISVLIVIVSLWYFKKKHWL